MDSHKNSFCTKIFAKKPNENVKFVTEKKNSYLLKHKSIQLFI